MKVLVFGFILLISASHVTSNEENEECLPDIDLIILLDGSYSVKPQNFQLVKNWVKQLADGMHIGHGHIQIGVVQYSHYYRSRALNNQRYLKTEIELGEYTDKASFDAAVDRIRYQGYKTYTAHAIEKAITYDFESEKSRYPKAKRAVILLTDGKATDASELPPVIHEAEHNKGVVMYTVGVGEYSLSELLLITGNHSNRVFELTDFNDLHEIIMDLQHQLRTACDCHALGRQSEACDPCSHACDCLNNVVGRRCDRCATATYGFGATDGCKECQCNPLGSINSTCDQVTGQCVCNSAGIRGRDCGLCLEGFFGFPECRKCECGGYSASCDQETGVCESCSSGRRGDHCEICAVGEHMNELSECIPCNCNGNINSSDPQSCDPTSGRCLKCLHNTVGDHCELCVPSLYGDATKQACLPCQCNPLGTNTPTTCDQVTGQCVCNSAGIRGRDCGLCLEGFFGFPECRKCECGGYSGTCDQEIGVCESCSSGRRGDHCEICPVGEYMNELSECIPCTCNGNINSSDPQSCDPTSGRCLKCLHNTVGDHCESCGMFYHGDATIQSCEECKCSGKGVDPFTCVDGQCACASNGACTCSTNVIGAHCDQCKPETWGLEVNGLCLDCDCSPAGTEDNSTCDQVTGKCVCTAEYTGDKCDRCDFGFFQPILDGPCIAFAANLINEVRDEEPTPADYDEPSADEAFDSVTQVRDEEPTPTEETTTTTTTTEPTTTTTSTTRRTTTKKPPRRINPGWSPCTTCGSSSWPSYCHGWVCKRRWPYHQQLPSPRRCYSNNLVCRASVNHHYRGSRYNYGNHGYGAGNYYNSYQQPSYQQPSYNNRRYYHHQRPRSFPLYSERYRNTPVRYNLYKGV